MSRARDAAARGARTAAWGASVAVIVTAAAAGTGQHSVPMRPSSPAVVLPGTPCPPGEVLAFAPGKPAECRR